MSESIRSITEDRIRTANRESQIAVFKTDKITKDGDTMFNAVFAMTRDSMQEIGAGENIDGFPLIGVFYGETGIKEFRKATGCYQ